MSFALLAGVTGLQAHQKMPDAAGNNQANVNTTALKSSNRRTFSEQLREGIEKASQPTSTADGDCYKLRHCSQQQIQTNQASVDPFRFWQRSMAELAAD